ncbi:MAG: polysaccharide biosynthesis/export family protein [Acidobacteria bacterium]|nr:polysaccharide biosynthesis/export family protein [Acidobacteriota bacterium]
MKTHLIVALSLSLLSTAPAAAQAPATPPGPESTPTTSGADLAETAEKAAAGRDYRIGSDDELTVNVMQAPELNRTTRVTEEGLISLPLVGSVQAGGLTSVELEAAIEESLARRYIKDPEVTVLVTEVRSRPVSVGGAVNRPGIQQARGTTRLLDVISLAGGLRNDAGDTVVVARKTGDGRAEPIEIPLKPLLESRDPELNVTIHAGDTVTVRTAETVYVVGAVKKPGAFAMRGNERLTVLQALALGEGLVPTAAQKDALVVRTGPDGGRQEIPVDLAAVLRGKRPDVPLEAQDVLFVPTSGGKVAARAALDAFIRVISWRPF